MKVGLILPLDEIDGEGRVPSWRQLRDIAVQAELGGLDSLWVFDHFFYDPEDDTPVTGEQEAWTVLSAVAAITERVELGTLVLCNSFREPGLVAKMAQTADEVSGGRLILGLGAGWHDPEYDAFGLPKDHRVARFEEALRIIAPLVDDGGPVTVDGTYYRAADARLLPPPSRSIPILIAGKGPRMLSLTTRFAQSWNTAWYGMPDERLAAMFAAMDAAMVAEGRDPAEMAKTVGLMIRESGTPPDPDEPSVPGTVDDLAAAFAAYDALGVDHLICSPVPCHARVVDVLCHAVAEHRGSPAA